MGSQPISRDKNHLKYRTIDVEHNVLRKRSPIQRGSKRTLAYWHKIMSIGQLALNFHLSGRQWFVRKASLSRIPEGDA